MSYDLLRGMDIKKCVFLAVNAFRRAFFIRKFVPSVSDAFVGLKETVASSHWLFL